MNVITAEKAYCLYPSATLEHRLSLICTQGNESVTIGRACERYRERGWRMVTSLCPSDEEFFQAGYDIPRWINDSLSFTIPLSYPSNRPLARRFRVYSVPLTCDPIAITTWTLVTSEDQGAHMSFERISNDHLFYSYVFASREVMEMSSVKYLIEAATESNADLSNDSFEWR